MLLPEVEYARPATLDDAITLLAAHPGARPLAGGQTLINVMKARAAAPDVLVDLADLRELRSIARAPDGSLQIGAMTTYSDLVTSSDVAAARPILGRVAGEIADVQVRNRGTLGGNVCANDPTNHFPPLMVAMGATMTIAGQGGERVVPAEEFFLGVYMTAVEPGELLTRVTVPAGAARDGFAATTIGRDGTCIVSAAASLDGGAPRIVFGCVDAVPVRAREMERRLADGDLSESAVRAASTGAGATLDPPSDVHATADYRRHLTEVLAVRAVLQAAGRS